MPRVIWQICRYYVIGTQQFLCSVFIQFCSQGIYSMQNDFQEILLIAENFDESCSNLHAFHLEYDYPGCTVCYLQKDRRTFGVGNRQ